MYPTTETKYYQFVIHSSDGFIEIGPIYASAARCNREANARLAALKRKRATLLPNPTYLELTMVYHGEPLP